VSSLGDELRLLIFVTVQALLLIACWRFTTRWGVRGVQRGIDTLLLTYLVQYAAVMLPGVVGVLSPLTMLGTAVLLSAALALTPSRWRGEGRGEGGSVPSLCVLVGVLLVSGYVLGYCWTQRLLPPMGTDALTYHFPAAVHWLQQGRIERFQAWFFNPANTFSPLAGSAWYAWLLGPIGNDTLAVHAQSPMVLLLFLAAVQIGRRLGASDWTAVLLAVAICLSRPVVFQLDKGKDDLFLLAFFATAVAAIVSPKTDPLRLWRVGLAVGLCLAIKYTAILAVPMLLLALRKPRWRDAAVVAGCVLALAGPWYLTNWVQGGNPLFPTDFWVFKGLFSTARSVELRSIDGILGAIVGGDFGVPVVLGVVLLLGWLIATAVQGLFRPQREKILVTLGPIIGLALFLLVSPYAEVRFLLPALLLMVVSLNLLPGRYAAIAAGVVALAAIATGTSVPSLTVELTIWGVAVVGVGMGMVVAQDRLKLGRDKLALAGVVLVLLVVGYAWIYWRAFVAERREAAIAAWSYKGMPGALWAYVRDDLPRGQSIAYTGTHLVYPLQGFELDRPVRHVSVRVGVGLIWHLPYLGDDLAGEYIDEATRRAMTAVPNAGAWLDKLRRTPVTHVVVLNGIKGAEAQWMAAMPERFEPVYADADGSVYRIKLPWSQASPAPAP
jgi:hypothetical protein